MLGVLKMSSIDINPSDLKVPVIPDIPENLKLPIGCLANTAFMFRRVFIQLAEGKPLSEIVAERGEDLVLEDNILETWFDTLGLDNDE
jgi:hypothetical protein